LRCLSSRLGKPPLLPTYADHNHKEDKDNNATPPQVTKIAKIAMSLCQGTTVGL
jgi:hypothetical protein